MSCSMSSKVSRRRQRGEQLDQPLALTPRQTGCGFVEQHDLGIGRDRHADLELPALAVREVGDLGVDVTAEPHPLGDVTGGVAQCLVARGPAHRQMAALLAGLRQVEVVLAR